ncbi:MAG: hypothetical protein Q8O87_02720 [bacterium]|nr:hypothetical protein [bacterium]
MSILGDKLNPKKSIFDVMPLKDMLSGQHLTGQEPLVKSAQELGKGVQEQISEPIAGGALKAAQRLGEATTSALALADPGTYVEDALLRLGIDPKIALSIGLAASFAVPTPGGEAEKSKRLLGLGGKGKKVDKALTEATSISKAKASGQSYEAKALDKTFQGLPNLSTKLLEKFRGMPEEITPQQFNEVINKATKEGIRKADLELVNNSLVRNKAGNIDLPKTAAKIEEQLVPLTPTKVKSPRHSGVGEEFIGDGKYEEIVFRSPIKTSAGKVHFDQMGAMFKSGDGSQTFPRYFSHARREVLPDGKGVKYVEWQSDLFQKENFAKEGEGTVRMPTVASWINNSIGNTPRQAIKKFGLTEADNPSLQTFAKNIEEIDYGARTKNAMTKMSEMVKDIPKLTHLCGSYYWGHSPLQF